MKTKIQTHLVLPGLIAAACLIGSATAFAQGGAPGGAAPGGAAAGNLGAQFLQGLLAGAGQGGAAGGGGRGGGNGAFQTASTVTVVADTTGNNLIISAPDEIMKQIDALIEELDVANEDTTKIQIFPLKNSDPTEMVTLITSLFPDPTTTAGRGNTAGRGAGGFQVAGGRGATSGTSDRTLAQKKVVAVVEARTS